MCTVTLRYETLFFSFLHNNFLFVSVAISSIRGNYLSDEACGSPWCSLRLILLSIKFIARLIGFLLFCVAACWYKKRVKDDDYSPHRVVEEVYDRYLTAAAEAPGFNS